MLNNLLSSSAIILYLIAGSIQIATLSGKLSRTKYGVLALGFIAVTLHAILLYHWIDIDGGQNLAFVNVLSQVAWIIALLVLLLAFFKPIESLTAVVLPFTAMSIVIVLLFPGQHIINTGANPKQLVHILLSFFALSVLLIAGVQALILALQDHLLRHHYSGPVIRALPALETMEGLLFQLIGFGFILLSVVLITSFLYFPNIFAKSMLQHTLTAIIAWIVFAILLFGRKVFGWRGRIAIRWTMLGVLLLIASYFGSRLLMELLV